MYKKLFVSLSVLALASCTENFQEDLADAQSTTLTEEETKNNHVSYSDVVSLTKAQSSETRAYDGQEPKIECITNSSNDTLLYIHQKPTGGWTIYSSDTRVPSVVAECDEGSVKELMECESVKEWIKWMSEDMEIISKLPDDKLKFTKNEVKANRAFWKSVSATDKYVKEKLAETGTRALPKYPGGHYKLVGSKSYNEDYDIGDRLTSTNWHQGSPYNSDCPNGYPAGCVAIAAAQMLYFLHYELGVPQEAPVAPGNNGVYNNYSSTIWDSMNDNGSDAAPLIANVGRLVDMNYYYDQSVAYTSDLPEKVFKPYGISCTYTDYNTTKLRTSLEKGIPVILRASANEGGGHAFIADRYKRYRQITVNYYEWVSDKPVDPTTPPPTIPTIPPSMKRYIDTIYSKPIINAIAMNWGWGEDLNTGWYTLTGDWVDPRGIGERQNWNINRHMIYNFKPINNN